jgi:hypothetical protein
MYSTLRCGLHGGAGKVLYYVALVLVVRLWAKPHFWVDRNHTLDKASFLSWLTNVKRRGSLCPHRLLMADIDIEGLVRTLMFKDL